MTARIGYDIADAVEIRRVLANILRMWWLLILLTIAAGAIGYGVSKWQTPVYGATTTLLVGQTMLSTELDSRDLATSQQLVLTYAGITRLKPVLAEAVERLDLNVSWRDLQQRVTATSVRDTQFLEIAVEADSPEEARVIADELANTLIRYSPTVRNGGDIEGSQQFARERLDKLQANIVQGQNRVDKLESLILAFGAGSLESTRAIQQELDTVQGLIVGWENNYARLLESTRPASQPNYLTIVEPAQGSTSPLRPNTLLNTLMAAAVGFSLALGAIFLMSLNNSPAPHLTSTLQQRRTLR